MTSKRRTTPEWNPQRRGGNRQFLRAALGLFLALQSAAAATETDIPLEEEVDLPSLESMLDIPSLDLPEIPLWQRLFGVRAAGGYKKNILLSPFRPESSPFVAAGLEMMLWRLPDGGFESQFFVSVDDTRYLSGGPVSKEQLAIGHAQLRKAFGNGWHGGATLQYLYQDQVLDVSATELDLRTLQVRGHSITLRPSIRRDLSPFLWTELEFLGSRDFLSEPLDDYWETGSKLSVTRQYGNRSDVSVSYEYNLRLYDTRTRTDRDGARLDGTSLRFHRHKTYVAWKHFWDQDRKWRTQTRAGWEFNQDNGSGFFDYHRFSLSQQVRFGSARSEIIGQARLLRYEYPVQTVSRTDSSLRRRTELVLSLRAETAVTRHMKLFAEYEYERALSNQAFGRYTVNTARGGAAFEF